MDGGECVGESGSAVDSVTALFGTGTAFDCVVDAAAAAVCAAAVLLSAAATMQGECKGDSGSAVVSVGTVSAAAFDCSVDAAAVSPAVLL